MQRRILGGLIVVLWAGGSLASCGGDSFSSDGGEGDAGTAGTGATGGSSTGGSPTGGNSTGGSVEGGSGNLGGSAGTGVPRGGSSGTSNGGSGAATGGTSGATTGGVGGAAGSGGNPNICSLPVAMGTCSGAMRRFAFNPVTGVCHPFWFTGCDGNANNFETIEACYAACGGQGEMDPALCEQPIDCKLVPSRCCGECGQASLETMVAVHASLAAAFSMAMSCHLVDCPACMPVENPWLGATCRAGRCIAFDARETELTDCESPTDCRLRAGLACCENCTASRQSFIALNGEADLEPWVCGDALVACPGCVPMPPANLETVCANGRCGVLDAELPQ